jgi:hypothetical protein
MADFHWSPGGGGPIESVGKTLGSPQRFPPETFAAANLLPDLGKREGFATFVPRWQNTMKSASTYESILCR